MLRLLGLVSGFGFLGYFAIVWSIITATFVTYIIGLALCFILNKFNLLSDAKADRYYDLLDDFGDYCYDLSVFLKKVAKKLYHHTVSFIEKYFPIVVGKIREFVSVLKENVKSFSRKLSA